MPTNPANPNHFIGKTVIIQIDRPLGSHHPQWGFPYPVNYGYLPEVLSADGEGLDAYVLGVDEPLAAFSGRCIAVLLRKDDPDDPKLVLAPPGLEFSDEEILAQVDFQERYFDTVVRRSPA
jgi:inorganic pyrophosphatase